MKNKIKVLVIGSINMDYVISVPRIPLIGETLKGNKIFTVPGGKGANQAVAASRLSAEVEMIGCVGNDEIGRELMSILRKEKVGVEHILNVPYTKTGQAFVTINEKGDNFIILSPGANDKLSTFHIQQCEELFKNADIILIQLEIPLVTVSEAINIANKYDVRIILNPAPALILPPKIYTRISILTPNEIEGKILLNQNLDSQYNSIQLVKNLVGLGAEKVILTLGEKGVAFNEGNDVKEAPSLKVKAIDTTAAGDSFNAGLAVSLAEGKSLSDSINFAQSVAALTISKYGAISSLPYRHQIDNEGTN